MKRFRERRRDADPRERVSRLGLLLLVLTLAGLGFLYAYPRLREPPLVERDLVGRVLDKSLTLRESQTGTTHTLRLLVGAADGRRSEVAVTPEQYQRARVGMWVRRSRGAVELSWDEPAAGAPRGDRVEGR